MHRIRKSLLFLAAVPLLAAGCAGDSPSTGEDPSGVDAGVDAGGESTEWDDLLAEREVDYSTALRKAALRLTGNVPTLAEIKFLEDAADQKAVYEGMVEAYIYGADGETVDPRFARQMVAFWQHTFKMGGTAMLDTAPVFAAQLVVEDRPYTELFTAQTGTCPTFDPATGAFTPVDCDNGVTTHAGVLTNPGAMAHYYSNMAFRRTRWVQETFDCTAFPAEVVEPQDVGGAAGYTAPWPFESIAGASTGAAIDFLDTSAVVCANCHATMNHIAPLFGYFDENGVMQADISVTNPTDGMPFTQMTDWLPEGKQETAWRLDVPAADLPALGAAMAADEAVIECGVARMWNWALGKGDIVDTLNLVPSETIAAHTQAFTESGYDQRALLLDIFTSEDFVRF